MEKCSDIGMLELCQSKWNEHRCTLPIGHDDDHEDQVAFWWEASGVFQLSKRELDGESDGKV